jgi:hypothetical protein
MAYAETPADWVASWSEDGTDVTFPIASVPELSAEDADAVSGDPRNIWFALCDHTYDWYSGLADADKPSKMSMTRTSSMQTDGSLRYTYTTTIYTDILTQEVVSE